MNNEGKVITGFIAGVIFVMILVLVGDKYFKTYGADPFITMIAATSCSGSQVSKLEIAKFYYKVTCADNRVITLQKHLTEYTDQSRILRIE